VVWVIDFTFLLIDVELKYNEDVLSRGQKYFSWGLSTTHVRVNLY